MRKRQEGGDSAEKYFNCTEQVTSTGEFNPELCVPSKRTAEMRFWFGVKMFCHVRFSVVRLLDRGVTKAESV